MCRVVVRCSGVQRLRSVIFVIVMGGVGDGWVSVNGSQVIMCKSSLVRLGSRRRSRMRGVREG